MQYITCIILIVLHILIYVFVVFSYGKIQSVKFTNDENGRAAVVAFMDIKSASKAHSAEIKLDGNVLHTEYSEASGGGVKVTRSAATASAASGSRYASSKPGYVLIPSRP